MNYEQLKRIEEIVKGSFNYEINESKLYIYPLNDYDEQIGECIECDLTKIPINLWKVVGK